MAAARPATTAQLAQLPGIGAKKLEAYGERFLRTIALTLTADRPWDYFEGEEVASRPGVLAVVAP